MKNNATTFFLLIGLLLLVSCSYDRRTSADVGSVSPLQANLSPTPTPLANFANKSEQTFRTVEVISKEPLVWIGSIYADELKTPKANDSIWNNGDYNETTHPEYIKIGTAIEVDIMNCAGYLISGKLNNVDALGWRLETVPETAATDALDKLKKCDPDADSQFPGSQAFAVALQNTNRKSIKIGVIDTKKLYASLPDIKRKWLEEEKKVYKTNPEFRDREKGNLTLRQDNWTDIDGDGKIDLVVISAVCEKDDSEGTSCSSILMLISGKWVEVGST